MNKSLELNKKSIILTIVIIFVAVLTFFSGKAYAETKASKIETVQSSGRLELEENGKKIVLDSSDIKANAEAINDHAERIDSIVEVLGGANLSGGGVRRRYSQRNH